MALTIAYAAINEGKSMLVEHPPRIAQLAAFADQLQTVFATVPLGEARESVVPDIDCTYIFASNGRFLAGCAVRRVAGQANLPESVLAAARAFVRDALKIAPSDARMALSEAHLQEMQRLLRSRSEAGTDAKIAEINAAIQRTRDEAERGVAAALAREHDLKRMQATSELVAEGAQTVAQRATEAKWTFFGIRLKSYAMIGAGAAVLIIIIVFMVCNPNLSACRSAAAPTTTTTAAPTTRAPVIIAGGGGP
jgi:hypothetical protein